MGHDLELPAPAGTAEAYLAGAEGDPGVLLFVDAIGLRPQTRAMADRIAGWGYRVLAPHPFYRSGTAAELAPQGDLREAGAREAFFAGGVMDLVAGLTPDLSDADADAWLEALTGPVGARGPVGVTGYCFGARLATRVAGRHPDVVAAVGGFHGGGLVAEGPDSPHLQIAAATAAFVYGHADQDPSMPPEAVAALERVLAASSERTGRPHRNEIYPGAQHGYTMADTSMYDEASAERHFTELRALLDGTLRA